MKKYLYSSQRELRAAFWREHSHYVEQGARALGQQNNQCATVRCDWCAWLDSLERDGQISERLADRATL